MARIDVAAVKRAGLPVDLDRLARDGDSWLTDEQRLALKKHGICGQAQPGVFMVRIRTGAGVVRSTTARALATVAARRGRGWIHLTTRQQIELHHVPARDVPAVIDEVADVGLTTSSTCGHTLRGVMACPAAGAGLDEPFDCHPDARAISASVMQRTPDLNHRLPQRVNVLLGGCPDCRDHARTNEVGLVSIGTDGEPGYELWVGGSLGRSQPALAWRLCHRLDRHQVLPAVHALIDVFVANGDLQRPHRARLKHLIADVGQEDFTALFEAAFARRRREPWPEPAALEMTAPDDAARILARAPAGGWSSGVRPQRTAGLAMVTVTVPLGDLDSGDLRALADIADEFADGSLRLTRNQNVMLQGVSLADVAHVRAGLAAISLSPHGADQSIDARVCTGGPVCSLAITPSAAVGAALRSSPAVARNSGLRLAVSGCPNGCAQHQVADLGFSGTQVTIAGRRRLGYQIWVGADLTRDRLGEVVGRVAAPDVIAVTDALIGVWEALRHPGESLAGTVGRIGVDGFQAQVGAVFEGRFEPGPEPDDGLQADRAASFATEPAAERRLPLVATR